MLKVAICDDENIIINQIEDTITEVCCEEAIAVDVDAYYKGAALEKEVMRGARYDIIYLDIQMEEGDGITTAKNIRKVDENAIIIFVSGFERYMMELFRLDVFSFIKKPIDKMILRNLFWEAYKKVCKKSFYFTYRYKSVEYKFPCTDILYFESNARQIKIYLKNGENGNFNGKLSDVVEKLEEGKIPFLRIHQSYLVNYHLIKGRTKSEVTLVDGTKLPISEDRQREFGQEYVRLLGGEINV